MIKLWESKKGYIKDNLKDNKIKILNIEEFWEIEINWRKVEKLIFYK